MKAEQIEKYIEKLSKKEKRIFFNKLIKWNQEQLGEEKSRLIKDAKLIIDFANKQWGKRFKHLDGYIKLIAGKLKDYSFEELQAVIIKQKNDNWFRKNPKYLNPQTIFGSKFHNYVQNINTLNEEDFEF